MTYQWLWNGNAFPDDAEWWGTNSATLTGTNLGSGSIGFYSVRIRDVNGDEVTSAAGNLAVITVQPDSQNVQENTSVSFSVNVAHTTTTIFYQWQKNGVDIGGQTAPQLNLGAVNASSAGSYRVRLTNGSAVEYSDTAQLTVSTPPAFGQHPQNAIKRMGGSVTFQASASGGTPPLTYQWLWNGNPFPDDADWTGSNTTTLTGVNVDAGAKGLYSLRVTDGAGAVRISNAANLAIITVQPGSQTVQENTPVGFSVNVDYVSTTIGYQWQKNGVDIGGQTSPQLNLGAVNASSAGSYRVRLTNGSAVEYSDTAQLTVSTPPSFGQHPQNAIKRMGGSVTFQASASGGTPPLTYQWLWNGNPFPDDADWTGSNTTTLTGVNVDAGAKGLYSLRVTDGAGAVRTSNAANLAIITVQPGSQTVQENTPVSFSVNVDYVSTTVGYQWQKNGVDIGGQTSPQLNLGAVNASSAGSYRVRLTNGSAVEYSDTAQLTVSTPPSFGQHPQNAIKRMGGTVTFQASASGGTPPLTYQWLWNGNPFPDDADWTGTNTTTLTGVNFDAGAKGLYSLRVTDGAGAVRISNAANLAIITIQPSSQTVQENTPVSFSVNVDYVSTTIDYQWQKNGVDIGGQTASQLNLGAVSAGSAGNYRVRLTNGGAVEYSDTAQLTVGSPPVFTQQPVSAVKSVGGSVTFSVVMNGPGPFTYQWFWNGQPFGDDDRWSGSTSSTLTGNDLQLVDAGTFHVEVTANGLTVSSNPAYLSFGGYSQNGTFYLRGVDYPAGNHPPVSRLTENIEAGDDPNTGPVEAVRILSGANIEFVAGATKRIRLAPGFHAQNGSRFVARISDGVTNDPPIITSSLLERTVWLQEGIAPYQIMAINSPESFNAFNLPPGLIFDGDSRIIGVPTEVGDYSSTILAINSFGQDEKTLVWKVRALGSSLDTDGDGIPDSVESQLGTDPNVKNTISSGNPAELKLHKPQP